MNGTAPPPRRARARLALAVALAGLGPLLLGLVVFRQGIQLRDDGLWLLGAQLLGQGGVLYRDLFVADGPARYVMLGPFLAAAGGSALGLVWLKSVCSAAAAAAGFWAAQRTGAGARAWLVPLGVVALGPPPPWIVTLGVLAVLFGHALDCARDRWLPPRSALLWGCAFGTLGWFGAGAGVAGAFVLLASAAIARAGILRSRALAARLAVGLLAVVALPLALAALSGALDTALWDTVVHPLRQWQQQMAHGGLLAWLRTLRSGAWLDLPFAELATGERLGAAWPAHAALRSLALRLLLLAIWVVPPLALSLRRRGAQAGIEAGLCAFALAGWGVLVPAGGLNHLRAGWLGSLWVLPAVLAPSRLPPRAQPVGRAAAWVLALGALGPLAAEPLWLGLHARRATLQTWERPRAGVQLSPARAEGLDGVLADIVARTGGNNGTPAAPVLIWPAQPGLQFLLDAPLATAQATVGPGEVRDPASVIASLDASAPPVALLSPVLSHSRDQLRADAPQLWSYLRRNYSLVGNVVDRPDEFRVLARVPGGLKEMLALPLPARLPDLEQAVGNDASPALVKDATVGQSFPVGDLDLAGIAVRWRTRRPDVHARVRVAVWLQRGGKFDTLLDFFDVDVTIARDLDRSFLRFGPITGTANGTVAVTFELRDTTPQEIRLLWHRHDATQHVADFLPDGSALVNMQPVAADLYFFSY